MSHRSSRAQLHRRTVGLTRDWATRHRTHPQPPYRQPQDSTSSASATWILLDDVVAGETRLGKIYIEQSTCAALPLVIWGSMSQCRPTTNMLSSSSSRPTRKPKRGGDTAVPTPPHHQPFAAPAKPFDKPRHCNDYGAAGCSCAPTQAWSRGMFAPNWPSAVWTSPMNPFPSYSCRAQAVVGARDLGFIPNEPTGCT